MKTLKTGGSEGRGAMDGLILRAIKHACVAGSCRTWATREPMAAPGLNRAARQHSALAGRLLTEFVEEAATGGSNPLLASQAPGGGSFGAS